MAGGARYGSVGYGILHVERYGFGEGVAGNEPVALA